MSKIFFNCSMPRAGSTLLQNVLMQNPLIHSTSTDPSFEFIYGARNNLQVVEAKAMDQKVLLNAYYAFCREGWKSYASALANGRENICIKHRGITAHLDLVSKVLGEKPKVIQLVRDARSIFSSYEKLYRGAQDYPSNIISHEKMVGTTTAKRIDIWSQSAPIGLAFERLEQLFLEGKAKDILFIKVEDFTSDPESQMSKIYSYLNLPLFRHDFENVEQFTKEDDEIYGLGVGLHKIRSKIEPLKPDYIEVLGKNISQNVSKYYSWYQNQFGYL